MGGMGADAIAGHEIRPAVGAVEMDAARRLFRTYRAEMREDLCFQEYEREVEGLPGEYAPPGGTLLLAWRGGEAEGCVALHGVASETPGRKVCEMKRLYALPGARGQGLGRAMAARIVAEARALGYDAIRLDTLPMMREAIALYRSMGFREIHAYRHNPVAGVLFLELDLAPGGAGLRVEVESAGDALAPEELRALRDIARAAGAEVSRRLGARGEARVRVVRDDEMARLHAQRLGVEGTTDVLTFDLLGAGGPEVDADIVVCADVARREAAARGAGDVDGAARELALYIVHGVLHCLGYDDHDDDASARMHAMEDDVLQGAGVGRVFDPSGEAERPRGGCCA